MTKMFLIIVEQNTENGTGVDFETSSEEFRCGRGELKVEMKQMM